VSKVFWQAKIWALLQESIFRALEGDRSKESRSLWQKLQVMQDWCDRQWDPAESELAAFEHIRLATSIAAASDRGTLEATAPALPYGENGIQISHLLSGSKLEIQFSTSHHQALLEASQDKTLQMWESGLLPDVIQQESDPRKVFWWLWRCLPIATCRAFGDSENLLLMPSDTRLPDSSIWNQTSLTSAMAGAFAGYDLTLEDIEHLPSAHQSHPYLTVFSFTPIQELIQASRKMRDFWAGSWILHYLSAKVSWALAWKYGPDSLIYPSLFKQPLIDYWLLNGTGDFKGWSDFSDWVDEPSQRRLLTAGFPNVIVAVLPKHKVRAAMQMAEETLRREWLHLAHLCFEELSVNRRWMKGLKEEAKVWGGWLGSQWQSYWSAVAIGRDGAPLTQASISREATSDFQQWFQSQNSAYGVQSDSHRLFHEAELQLLIDLSQHTKTHCNQELNVNVGSWWPFIFDKTRTALAGSKNARTWELPTAFGVRSTISGLGAAVHPGDDWTAEGKVKQYWKHHAGLFDGREQLNATETVKRTLHQVLPQVIGGAGRERIKATYPDLTAGVAGYLKVGDKDAQEHFEAVCSVIEKKLKSQQLNDVLSDLTSWGIPYADEKFDSKRYHSRYLNPDWLLEDSDRAEEIGSSIQEPLQSIVDRAYPKNNPADWYVLAAGDGDEMNAWLKGQNLRSYKEHISEELQPHQSIQESFNNFVAQTKRMGPSSHSGLSRALLDFSNQLVPYLTEDRYAGRLIYSGGDDVLAYSSLWEWDKWVWDIRQCFRGQKDDGGEFQNHGHYWQWIREDVPTDRDGHPAIDTRPLFTMGERATISFGIVIAHRSVPLAIALEQLHAAEKEGAKQHKSPNDEKKDAIQIRVLYGSGNILQATSKFEVFNRWRSLLAFKEEHSTVNFDPALFEQAAELFWQYPIPVEEAIETWVQAFCDRRDIFTETPAGQLAKQDFKNALCAFIKDLWQTTPEQSLSQEFQRWLKLAAFVLRKREIKLGEMR